MTLDDLRFNPVPSRFPQHRLYAFSGRGSIGMIPDTVTGIGAFYFPPVSGKHFQCYHRLVLPDLDAVLGDSAAGTHYTPHRIMLQSIEWMPWRIRRQGIFHHHIGGRLVTLRVQHDLIAPADADGLLVRLELELVSPRSLRVEIRPALADAARAFGVCTPLAWNYEVPAAEGIVWSEGPDTWRTDGCTMTMMADAPSITLQRGKPLATWQAMSLSGDGLRPFNRPLASHGAAAEAYWRARWAVMHAQHGQALEPMPAPRQKLFARAWLTTQTCRWMRENFVARPFYSAEGIDGGSVCSYLWDVSYTSAFLARMEGRPLADLIRRYLDPDAIFKGYSINPLDGRWLGVFYAFSPYALTRIVEDYVRETRDVAFAKEALPVLEQILMAFDKRWRTDAGILDFGNNRHLIELHTAGYQGLVPNPNFEHAWSLLALNRLRTAAGLRKKADATRRAKEILEACERLFWNRKAGWYFPADQRGKAGIWSIQILSALRLGVFPPENVERLAGHIRDGRFLGPSGLYSIAKDDTLHFTLNDSDWGGDGCFCGHTGIVIEGFARLGMKEVANRILDRIQWWADDLPYIPQETRADAPDASHGRPNLVSAGAVCEALLLLHGTEQAGETGIPAPGM